MGQQPVGRPDVMQFAGALQAQRANKGILSQHQDLPMMLEAMFLKLGAKLS